jgi:peptidoglycan/LPS O-acetylase OafA/YrhL
MTTEYSQRFHGLDHLRSMAIILVLLYHYGAFTSRLDRQYRKVWLTGVDLFVLSGFLISSQLLKEMENRNTICLKTFYIKRFFRIVPPYLLTLLLYFSSPFSGKGKPCRHYGNFTLLRIMVWMSSAKEHFLMHPMH